jgi:hypothetical protein
VTIHRCDFCFLRFFGAAVSWWSFQLVHTVILPKIRSDRAE